MYLMSSIFALSIKSFIFLPYLDFAARFFATFFSRSLKNNLTNEDINITPKAIAKTIKKVSRPQFIKPCLSICKSDSMVLNIALPGTKGISEIVKKIVTGTFLTRPTISAKIVMHAAAIKNETKRCPTLLKNKR